ncbi:hypothetical protein [Dactylosporangium salmoneum]|uniref:Uncharacterized protein n=1 Tax=Dactylosporangium salmoneum TaxID=53361 RepID=A0ABP5SZ28_9ACTN
MRERDRDDWDCLDQCVAATRSDSAEVSRAGARFVSLYRRFIYDSLPANWPEVFAALRPS